jgi:hypothetical protein
MSRRVNISESTKAALAAAKARGAQGAVIGRARGSKAVMANTQAFAERLRPVLVELASLSANAAAQELDRRGYATPRGGEWTAHSVINVRARLAGAAA